jgi:hypothetical protein
MPDAIATKNVAAQPADEDLSGEIERSIAKEPLDRIRCVRVFENYYRCNWWAPAQRGADPRDKSYNWGMLTTHHVRRSRFVTATVEMGQLVIKEVERVGR